MEKKKILHLQPGRWGRAESRRSEPASAIVRPWGGLAMHKSIAAAVIVSLAATSAYPQQPAPETVRLPEVSVSATRTERDVNEVPATVTVIPGEEIEQKQVRDIRDLIRYEPGVEVPTNTAGGGPGTFTRNPSRPGNSGYSIRGIEGNRVQIVVDGIRVPDGFSFGSFAAPSRDLVDLDLLSRVEILRGPASSLYGSDALGGVVIYTTVDPADLLKRLGGRSYFFGRGAFAGADESLGANAGFALDAGAVQMLAIVTRREGHEIDNKGTNGAADRTAYLVRNELRGAECDRHAGRAPLLLRSARQRQLRAHARVGRLGAPRRGRKMAARAALDGVRPGFEFPAAHRRPARQPGDRRRPPVARPVLLIRAANHRYPAAPRDAREAPAIEPPPHLRHRLLPAENRGAARRHRAQRADVRSRELPGRGRRQLRLRGRGLPGARFPQFDHQPDGPLRAGRDPDRAPHAHPRLAPRPLPRRARVGLDLRRRQPGDHAGAAQVQLDHAAAGRAVAAHRCALALRPGREGLPRSAVQRREHRLHQPAVRLHGGPESEPQARKKHRPGARLARDRGGRQRRPRGVRQPLPRLH